MQSEFEGHYALVIFAKRVSHIKASKNEVSVHFALVNAYGLCYYMLCDTVPVINMFNVVYFVNIEQLHYVAASQLKFIQRGSPRIQETV